MPHAEVLPTVSGRRALGAAVNLPGVTDRDPEPIPCDAVRAREVAGRSDIDVMTLVIASDETVL
jgi:hypothetical protein